MIRSRVAPSAAGESSAHSAGKLLAFSGLDSSGKSTLIRRLGKDLAAQGHHTVSFWSRVGYTSGVDALKRLARPISSKAVSTEASPIYPARASSFSGPLSRRLWLTLSLLDLIRLYAIQCRWWLWRGRTVLCDRYMPDVLIDLHLNFPEERVETWWLWHVLDRLAVKSDHAFVMLIPAELSVERSEQRGRDSERIDILQRRIHAYRALAERGGYRVLDGRLPVEALLQAILDELKASAER